LLIPATRWIPRHPTGISDAGYNSSLVLLPPGHLSAVKTDINAVLPEEAALVAQ